MVCWGVLVFVSALGFYGFGFFQGLVCLGVLGCVECDVLYPKQPQQLRQKRADTKIAGGVL